MTCIVGVAEGGKVWIGGDSAGVDGRYGLTVRADRKVFRNGPMIMGFTSSFRMGQLLAHALKVPRRHPDDGIYGWMVTEFIDAVRSTLKSGGYAEHHDGAERGGEFLVGYEGRLFTVNADYQVGENADGYAACGCGDMIALGALHALGPAVAPEERVRRALEATERFSGGVRGPFHIESIGEADPADQEAA